MSGAATLEILKPTTEHPNALGSTNAPNKSTIETTKPTPGLHADDFAVEVGGAPAVITALYESASRYHLEVIPPALPGSSSGYDVSVDAGGQSATAVGGMATFAYPPAAVVLLIDRSASMWDQLQRTAAAAARFLDRLSEHDMVGVATFNSHYYELTKLEYPLTEIVRGDPLTVYFVDDMESGETNWSRLLSSGNPIGDLQYWLRVTTDSHSGDYAWAYNPNGGSTGTDKRLVSRSINLSTATKPYLSFWFRLDRPPGTLGQAQVDWLVRLSTDGGVNWEQHPIFTDPFNPDNYDLVTDGVWKWLCIPMPGCAGKSNVQFEIRSWGGFTYGANLWVDDVAVVENLTALDFAKAALARLGPAHGETSIGAGMELARIMLNNAGWRERVMVILTDGEENESPFVANVLPSVAAAGIAVTGIGVGGELPASLRHAVSLTGGSFTQIASADQIASVYSQIADKLTGEDSVGQVIGSVTEGGTQEHIFQIDPTSSEATFTLFWGEERDRISFSLSTPSGTVIDPAYAETHGGVEFVNLEEHGYARVETPEPGAWVMRVTGIVASGGGSPEGTGGGSGDINYTAMASVRSNLRVSVFTATDEHPPGEPIGLAVAVSDTAPILGATVSAQVGYYTNLASQSAPTTVFPLTFSDPDSDGVYEAQIPGAQVASGTYQFDLTATGISNGTNGVSFTRQLTEYVTAVPPFRLTSVHRESSGDVTLKWEPAPTDATIEYSTNLTDWQEITNGLTGSAWTGSLPGKPDRAFLRLRATAPTP